MTSDSTRTKADKPRRQPVYRLPGVNGEGFAVPLAGSTLARAARLVRRLARDEVDGAELLAMLGLDSTEQASATRQDRIAATTERDSRPPQP
ncbi:hypothetical protein [Amycolatopsis speibonae]|uniref:Uncharacterized protein n=1 Tax=Amycolatopsis speibonae TaxID=1450224 RepID=A0ABV7PAL9_9PSEU